MSDAELIKTLNAFAVRIVFLECQVLTLQRILEKTTICDEQTFDQALAKIVADAKDVLGPEKTDAERLAEFLRTFEGPPQ
jgi:hypothetical protein